MTSIGGVFTDDEIRSLYERMMDLMLRAKWLHSYTFTEGKGFWLNWTEIGTARSICLRKIIRAFRLMDHDTAALCFDRVAHGESLPPGSSATGKLEDVLASYWRESVAELGIARTEDDLLILVQILDGWAPDAGTGVKIG